MVAIKGVRPAMVVFLLVAVAASAFGDEEQLLSSPQPSPASSFVEGLSLNKRSFYDYDFCSSFDLSVIGRLNRVCDSCYNYYRKSYVAVTCRRKCFKNEMFLQCLDELFDQRTRKQYMVDLQRVGK